MKYYLIKESGQIKNTPHIMNWMKKIDERNIVWGKYNKISRITTLYVQDDYSTVFPDVLSRPFFLVTDKLHKILELYEPNMDYRQIVLIDKKRNKAVQYFMPHLQVVDCLGEDTIFNMDHSELKHIVLDKSKMPDKSIFQLDRVSNRYVVVNLNVLESFLRRGAILHYEEIDVL